MNQVGGLRQCINGSRPKRAILRQVIDRIDGLRPGKPLNVRAHSLGMGRTLDTPPDAVGNGQPLHRQFSHRFHVALRVGVT